MATKKNIIWSNYNLNLADWCNSIKEMWEINGIDPSTKREEDYIDEMYLLNSEYLNDERRNLDIMTAGRIIAIADIGTWNGRKTGYKLFDRHNIKACLSFESGCDYGMWWVDSFNNLRSMQTHHDGTNYILYREIKPEVTSDQLDCFCWRIYRGIATSKDITKYTRSLGKTIKNVYGWDKPKTK